MGDSGVINTLTRPLHQPTLGALGSCPGDLLLNDGLPQCLEHGGGAPFREADQRFNHLPEGGISTCEVDKSGTGGMDVQDVGERVDQVGGVEWMRLGDQLHVQKGIIDCSPRCDPQQA